MNTTTIKLANTVSSLYLLALILLLSGCYVYEWSPNAEVDTELSPPPSSIEELFSAHLDGILRLKAVSPASTYKYDAWEKDKAFAQDSLELLFDDVSLALHDDMPAGKVMVDMTFTDSKGNEVHLPDVDLMRLIPYFNTSGDHLYPELLLEEFNRFGVSFRKEFGEFQVVENQRLAAAAKSPLDGAFRASLTNGCLEAGKWEFAINSEDYSDFNRRVKDSVNFNQTKILAHNWFMLDTTLYRRLLHLKNPATEIDNFDWVAFDYQTLSDRAKEVTIDFDKLRAPIKKTWKTKTVEIGHRSNRPLALLDMEQHYKIEYGLFLDHTLPTTAQHTYRTIVEPENQPLRFAQFRDEGFYSPSTPLEFDINWLSHLDSISISSVDIPDTECLVEIKVTGKWSPYTVTVGNIDLSQTQEQSLFGLHFGFNVYPKGRRYNPAQPTISFDEDLMPKEYERYLLLTDTKTGKWVDNFHKGLGKVFLTYSTLEKDVLEVYLISYERILPMWMGSVKLPRELREKVRVRSQLYNY